MGSRKYFFFDYDGTLAISLTRTIPESARRALEQLRANGHFVALATGRMQCNALDYIESAGIDNVVADGGYSITVGGELKWMQGLDLESMKACLRRLDAINVPWAVQTENVMHRVTPYPEFERIAGDYYVPTVVDENLTIDSIQQVLKIYLPCKAEDADELLATGVLDDTPWVRYDKGSLFVEPLEKALGIKKMMDYFDAPYEDVVVFGDGTNDVSMFTGEWTAIAMGNAVPQLKERATYITTNVDDDGVWNACRHFGWI